MKTFLSLFAVAAVAALSYWQVPVRRLLHLPVQAASAAHPDRVGEAAAPAAPASGPSAASEPMPAPAAMASAAGLTKITPATPAPAPAVAVGQKAALASQVARAQQAAIAKYPALGVAGSEINSRFVFRYKALLAQQSPRLLDPSWPVQLADECAAASTVQSRTVAHR